MKKLFSTIEKLGKPTYECRLGEKLVLESEDWTEAEWATICKLFDAENAYCILVEDCNIEVYSKGEEK